MPLSFDNTEIAFAYKGDKELKRAYLLFWLMKYGWLTKLGIALTKFSIAAHLPVKGLIRKTIFNQFCGGEDLKEASETSKLLGEYKVSVALDYGVEGKASEADYDAAVPEFIKAINYASQQSNIPFIPIKVTGFAPFSLLEKKDSEERLSAEEQAAWERVRVRIDQVCAAAANKQLMVLIDAEHSWIQKPVDELANTMMERYNQQYPAVFNTFQIYRHDRLAYLKTSLAEAQKKGYVLGAKLVRGAYMEQERQRAAKMGYRDPIQPSKAATDQDYDEGVRFCLEHLNQLGVFIGTHNEKSCSKVVAYMNEAGIPHNHPHVWMSQLYGMSDNLTFNLAAANFNMVKYLPYGPVVEVIPYLMRRAQENSSVGEQTGRELNLLKKEVHRRKL